MKRGWLWTGMVLLILPGGLEAQSNAGRASQVRQAEQAFAKTMADRDHAAFVVFLSDEAIFIGGKGPLRGKKAVAAPFSWAPERVEVLDSGMIALSTGPVHDPTGKRVGTFNSVWRRDQDGKWRIILDNGCPPCACP